MGELNNPACHCPLPQSQAVWDMFISPLAYFACLCGWASSDHTNYTQKTEKQEALKGCVELSQAVRSSNGEPEVSDGGEKRLHS